MNRFDVFNGATVIKVEGSDLYFDNGKILSISENKSHIESHDLLSEKNYKRLSKEFVGKSITDIFCNGFFDGSKEYDLIYSEIIKVKEHDDEITIVVSKSNGEYDYGRFDGDWKYWKSVYEHLIEWTK